MTTADAEPLHPNVLKTFAATARPDDPEFIPELNPLRTTFTGPYHPPGPPHNFRGSIGSYPIRPFRTPEPEPPKPAPDGQPRKPATLDERYEAAHEMSKLNRLRGHAKEFQADKNYIDPDHETVLLHKDAPGRRATRTDLERFESTFLYWMNEEGASFRDCVCRLRTEHQLIVDHTTLFRFLRRGAVHQEKCEKAALEGLPMPKRRRGRLSDPLWASDDATAQASQYAHEALSREIGKGLGNQDSVVGVLNLSRDMEVAKWQRARRLNEEHQYSLDERRMALAEEAMKRSLATRETLAEAAIQNAETKRLTAEAAWLNAGNRSRETTVKERSMTLKEQQYADNRRKEGIAGKTKDNSTEQKPEAAAAKQEAPLAQVIATSFTNVTETPAPEAAAINAGGSAAPNPQPETTPQPQPDQPATTAAPVVTATARNPVGYRCVDTLINAKPTQNTNAAPSPEATPTTPPTPTFRADHRTPFITPPSPFIFRRPAPIGSIETVPSGSLEAIMLLPESGEDEAYHVRPAADPGQPGADSVAQTVARFVATSVATSPPVADPAYNPAEPFTTPDILENHDFSFDDLAEPFDIVKPFVRASFYMEPGETGFKKGKSLYNRKIKEERLIPDDRWEPYDNTRRRDPFAPEPEEKPANAADPKPGHAPAAPQKPAKK
jgi:hypothetical protein